MRPDLPTFTLGAATKALTDVVAPALPDTDPLAREQLALVIDYLDFLRRRLDYLSAREHWELRDAVRTGHELLEVSGSCSPESRRALMDAIEKAEGLLSESGIDLERSRESIEAVAGAVRELVREAGGLERDERLPIERCVVGQARRRIDIDRVWYAPLRLGAEEPGLPPLHELLAR